MKITLPLLVVSAFLMTACDSTVLDKQKPQAVTDKAQHYQCESGEVILASYISTDEASLVYKDTTYKMTIETSASGARYVSEDLEWWTKGSGVGSEGVLLANLADRTSGDVLELCAMR